MNLSYIALIYYVIRALFIGVTFNLLKNNVYQDLWISMIMSIIIGLIFILLLKYICKFKDDKNIIEKINILFPKSKYILHTITIIIISLLIIINFWNLTNLITSQFLSKTPKIIIGITFIIPITYIVNQKLIIIPRVSLILFYISIILYILCGIGLMNHINIMNLLPIQNNPIKGIIPYISYNIMPIFMILILPNEKIDKNLLIGYFIGSISILIVALLIISILGINLTLLYRYSEFHILKFAFETMINYRLENILSIQWLFDIFIFNSIGLKYIMLAIKKNKTIFLPFIYLIISIYLIPSIFTFENIISSIVPIIFVLGIILYISLYIKIKTYE